MYAYRSESLRGIIAKERGTAKDAVRVSSCEARRSDCTPKSCRVCLQVYARLQRA